jgi:malonate transporter MadL subunit
MAIYGTAVLSICLIIGITFGKLLGHWAGMDPKVNVGGVGFAMLLLIVVTDWMRKRDLLRPPSEAGILFWSSIYIPVVVAMAATLNVRDAVGGGPMALLAGSITVICCFALIPAITRIGKPADPVEK